MAILDKKNRILDVMFTDRGRELLSQNRLDVTYYAFSDEGIDYSVLLSSSMSQSQLDDVIYQTFVLEADQRTFNYSPKLSASRTVHNDIHSFLYTIPPSQKVTPRLRTSITGSTTILRKYVKEDLSALLSEDLKNKLISKQPIDVVVKVSFDPSEDNDREFQFANDQIAVLAKDLIELRTKGLLSGSNT